MPNRHSSPCFLISDLGGARHDCHFIRGAAPRAPTPLQGQAMNCVGRSPRLTGCRTVLSLILAAAIGCGKAPGKSAPPAESAFLAKGEEITEKMLTAYRRAKSYTDHATYIQQSVYRGEGV